MTTSIKRRVFLKRSLAVSAVGVAASAGLLVPQTVLAEWPKAAFDAKETADALKNLMGASDVAESSDIKIKAPDIAENGAVVPVTVSTSMADVESIALVAAGNNLPLIAAFNLGKDAEGFVSTRIKMGKTGDVEAIVKAGGKLYTAKKSVKVTIGGCGG